MTSKPLPPLLHPGAGRTAVWIFTSDVDAVEVLASCGFDAIILDRQHTAVSLERTLQQVRAVRAAAMSSVLVRLPSPGIAEIAPLLDMGVDGLLLPDARSAGEVAEFVAATRYPPHGARGAHDTVSRAAGYGRDTADYRRSYRDDILVVAMIVSLAGVDAAAAMADVDGLDMLFVGPLDLSASVGALGDWDAPAYRDALTRLERTVLGAGVLLGGALAPPGDAAAWAARGHALVSIGSDVTLLRAAALGALEARGTLPPAWKDDA